MGQVSHVTTESEDLILGLISMPKNVFGRLSIFPYSFALTSFFVTLVQSSVDSFSWAFFFKLWVYAIYK